MYHSRLKTVYGIIAILFALSLVCACGQKGDLYLPDEQQSSLSKYSSSA